MNLLAVALGGALGAVFRAICTDVLRPRLPKSLPYPTLLINLTACFLMGVMAQLSLGHTLQLALCMGFLGGFSTLAALCYEAVDYFVQKDYRRCFGYLTLSYLSCLAATSAGFALSCVL